MALAATSTAPDSKRLDRHQAYADNRRQPNQKPHDPATRPMKPVRHQMSTARHGEPPTKPSLNHAMRRWNIRGSCVLGHMAICRRISHRDPTRLGTARNPWPGRGVAGQANSRRESAAAGFTWFRRPVSLGRLLLDVEARLVRPASSRTAGIAGHERRVGDNPQYPAVEAEHEVEDSAG